MIMLLSPRFMKPALTFGEAWFHRSRSILARYCDPFTYVPALNHSIENIRICFGKLFCDGRRVAREQQDSAAGDPIIGVLQCAGQDDLPALARFPSRSEMSIPEMRPLRDPVFVP